MILRKNIGKQFVLRDKIFPTVQTIYRNTATFSMLNAASGFGSVIASVISIRPM
jgi:hypothetical protein